MPSSGYSTFVSPTGSMQMSVHTLCREPLAAPHKCSHIESIMSTPFGLKVSRLFQRSSVHTFIISSVIYPFSFAQTTAPFGNSFGIVRRLNMTTGGTLPPATVHHSATLNEDFSALFVEIWNVFFPFSSTVCAIGMSKVSTTSSRFATIAAFTVAVSVNFQKLLTFSSQS